MTAEQLEELLGRVTQEEWKAYPPHDGWCCMEEPPIGYDADLKEADATLVALAPSLARRVIAAEKLVEALSDAVDAWETHCLHGDGMQGYWAGDARDALTAYREASK